MYNLVGTTTIGPLDNSDRMRLVMTGIIELGSLNKTDNILLIEIIMAITCTMKCESIYDMLLDIYF